MKEKKARVEDALHSTRAAVEEGVVPGGGVALIRALQSSEGLKGDNEDQNIGISIALKAMEAPIRQIVLNAGEEASVVVDKIKSEKPEIIDSIQSSGKIEESIEKNLIQVIEGYKKGAK